MQLGPSDDNSDDPRVVTARLDRIEAELAGLRERNRRVEADKFWEVSVFRRVLIATITYAVTVIVFTIINTALPFFQALVPTAAYLLSTLTVPLVKRWWLRKKLT